MPMSRSRRVQRCRKPTAVLRVRSAQNPRRVMQSRYARLNVGSLWPAAAIPREGWSEVEALEVPDGVSVVDGGGGVLGASVGAALGLTGVPGLVPELPDAGGGLGLFVVGAALGLTGVPGFVALSRSVAGAALGLAACACASRLHASKSACVGSAASARPATASRLTPETISRTPVNACMVTLALLWDSRLPAPPSREDGKWQATEAGEGRLRAPYRASTLREELAGTVRTPSERVQRDFILAVAHRLGDRLEPTELEDHERERMVEATPSTDLFLESQEQEPSIVEASARPTESTSDRCRARRREDAGTGVAHLSRAEADA